MLSEMNFAVKRAIEGGDDHEVTQYVLPSWAWIVILLDLVLLLPLGLLINYTFQCIFPTLAIVENEDPPAYEPVSLEEELGQQDHPVRGSKPTHGRPQTVTSSVRSMNRLLYSVGGPKGLFRGFWCFVAQSLLTFLVMAIFTGALGGYYVPLATLLSSLVMVQYSTAWVHIVMSAPSPLSFWRRLPSFKRAFDATWRAVALSWFAMELARFAPVMTMVLLGMKMPDFGSDEPTNMDDFDGRFFCNGFVVMLVGILASIFITVPAHVILVRVQASLLPEMDEPIIPFDRSFQGTVEPAVVSGRGYATISEAWATFSKGAWRRLVTLYIKIFAVCVAGTMLIGAVLVPEAIILAKYSEKTTHNV